MRFQPPTKGNGLNSQTDYCLVGILITTDKGIPFQQNLSQLRLAIVVLPTTDWSLICQNVEAIIAAINSARPGALIALNWS